MIELIAAVLGTGSVGGGGGGGGGGADPSYDLIVANWGDITVSPNAGTNSPQTLTFAQTSPRVLLFSFPGMTAGSLYYKLGSASYVAISSGATLAVVTTNTLSFKFVRDIDTVQSFDVTVYDTTNASAVIDTFTCTG